MVTAITVSSPKRCSNGASANTRPMAEQFGLVTTNPPDLRRQVWVSISVTWQALTSGMTSGTSVAMRRALELETTAQPASANRGSGPAGDTVILATRSGIDVFSRHRAASPYARPSERSEAASQATSNHGWCSSICTKRCPTIPVAPRIPTGILVCMMLLGILQHRSSGAPREPDRNRDALGHADINLVFRK